MRIPARRAVGSVVAVLLLGWLASVMVAVAPASALPSDAQGELSAPLGASEAQTLLGGEGAAIAAEVERDSPEAALAREESETRYVHLDPAQVASLAGEAFPSQVREPAGGPPALAAGERITGYLAINAATVELSHGQRGVIESTAPMAISTASGLAPVDLSLKKTTGGFKPVAPPVSVSIPADVGAGVSIPALGVSITPVHDDGAPLGGPEGSIVGATVLYAGAEPGVDDLAKPTATGFELDSILQSAESPTQLFFRVGVPQGAQLVETHDGAPEVVENGASIARVALPSAVDAAGTSVPATISTQGDTIALSVAASPGEYQYPIYVDPTLEDTHTAQAPGGPKTNWEFHDTSAAFGHEERYEGAEHQSLRTYGSTENSTSENAFWGYQTQGVSKIWEFNAETEGQNKGDHIESFLELQEHGTGKKEGKVLLSTEGISPEYTKTPAKTLCHENSKGEPECSASAAGESNAVHFEQAVVTGGGPYGFADTMSNAVVHLAEPAGTHSTASYNTSSPDLEYEIEEEGKKLRESRTNALYGSGNWLSASQGALELAAGDNGIGVAATRLEYEVAPGHWERLMEHDYLTEGKCKGVQCYAPGHDEYWTLTPTLPNGEDKIRYHAEEAIEGTGSLESEGEATIKVDHAKPRHLAMVGAPYGNELSERAYKLTVEATDGEGTATPSSGIRSLELAVDKHILTATGGTGACAAAKGECTATAEYVINGAELGAGHHAIVIAATSNSGEEARDEETLSVRHSTPLALGPGSVDLQSGDFSLGASDISLNGLTVSRSYSSRDTTQGDEGPLGPEWSLGLSSTDSLVELANGSMLMTAANGGQTIFAKTDTAAYESPPGDSNLSLTVEESKEHVKEAFYLKDAADHSSVKFTLPQGGTKDWVPTRQEGTSADDTVTMTYRTVDEHDEYNQPTGSEPYKITTGPDGNLWFTDYTTGKIGKITPAGVTTEYSLPPGSKPVDITAGPDDDLWFTNEGTGSVGKMTTSGVVTEYPVPTEWHDIVSGITEGTEGNLWFTGIGRIGKMTPTGSMAEYPVEAIVNSITTGPDGNLWFGGCTGTYCGTAKIGRITTSGAVTLWTVDGGTPDGLTAGPSSEASIWFAMSFNKIGRITTSGVITEYSTPPSTMPQAITLGADGNLWFAAGESNKIEKITPAGAITEYALPEGSKPTSITSGPEGNLWFTEAGTSKVGMMSTAGTITEPAEEIGPKANGVECPAEGTERPLQAGCRVLKFEYANETTATGEAESEWGEYRWHLSKVLYEAYNPKTEKLAEPGVAVAEYRYDKYGRLRAEWDPRLPHPLKTTYGYDEEGHITSLTPPGEEPWTFTYGTADGDEGSGRLVKLDREQPQAGASEEEIKAKLAAQREPMKNSEPPKITGTPTVGVRMAVSKGKWSGAAITYAYQWEDCNPEGSECARIIGATNPNYTARPSDVGHELVAVVTATNIDGTASASTAATGAVTTAWGETVKEYELPSGSEPWGITAGPNGNMWYTDSGTGKVGEITTTGSKTEFSAEHDEPEGITAGPDGNLWFVEHAVRHVNHMTTAGELTTYTLSRTSTYNTGIAVGPEGDIWFTESRAGYIGKMNTNDEVLAEYKLPGGSEPWGIAAGPNGEMWYTDRGTSKIGEMTTAGVITAEYELPGSGEPSAIVSGPENDLWFTEESSDEIGKITTGGTMTNYELPSGSDPAGITVGSEGDVWFTEYGTSKLGRSTESGTITEYPLPAGSEPRGIALGPGGVLWFDEAGTSKIGRLALEVEEYAMASGSEPSGIADGPDGNLWVTEKGKKAIAKVSPAGGVTSYKLSTALRCPNYITAAPNKEAALYFTSACEYHIGEITTAGVISSFPLETGVLGPITVGPDGNLWYTVENAEEIGKMTPSGTGNRYSLPSGSKPNGLAVGADGELWFSDNGTNRIGKITTAGSVTEYALPAGSDPWGMAAGPENDVWFVEYGTCKVAKVTTAGVITEYSLPAGSDPGALTEGPEGNMWVAEYAKNRLAVVTPSGSISERTLPTSINAGQLVTGPEGNMWFTEPGASTVAKLKLPNVGSAEQVAPEPGTTIEYNIPLEGKNAPAQMGYDPATHHPEPERWGQSDDPVEGTAVIPEDSPQGWPASSYKRATVYYLDEQGRQVNVSAPSVSTYGSISTTEYNEYNDVIRTLTADNRATALAAGEGSEELSKKLDTESVYNEPECPLEQPGEAAEPGTRLCETLGPRHEIKLQYPDGHGEREVLARNHEEYFYDQGVPKEKPYSEETFDLVTETSDLALLENRENLEVRTTRTSYAGASNVGSQKNIGWKLREPTSVTIEPRSKEADPKGLNLTTTTLYNEAGQVIETRGAAAEHTLTFASKFGEAGSEPGKLEDPAGVAVNGAGDLWVVDSAQGRLEEFGPEGKYIAKIGEAGAGTGQLKEPSGLAIDSKGNLWVADSGNNNILEFSPEGRLEATITATCAEGGKLKAPAAVAFDAEGRMWVADAGNNKIEKYKEGKCVSEWGSAGSEPGKLAEPKGIAIDSEGHIWVSDTGNDRIEEFTTTGSLLSVLGGAGSGEGQLDAPQAITFDSAGYLWVADGANDRVQAFSPSGAVASQAGWLGSEPGQLHEPRGVAFDAHGNLWVTDSANNRIEEWSPGPNAHDSKIVYYGSEANTEGFPGCGKHPEWAGLPCETTPAKQPELDALGHLPVTTTTYNMWLEPEKVEETFTWLNSSKHEETSTRTKIEEYDEAGRLTGSETNATNSPDKTLPKVTVRYNSETGLTAGESAGGKSTSEEYNLLGQLVKYTDANGNSTTYKYGGAEHDDLLEEVVDGRPEVHEGKERASFQRYFYEETTRQMTKLEDSAAGIFTAAYDAEGNLTSETYPNNMCADYTRNPVGETTSVEYLKTANCAETEAGVWYSDSQLSSIHGQIMTETSTLATENYTYDDDERLTEVQETPAGEGCTVRAYSYDEESNRASLTTRKPASKCETEGGTTEAHNYTEAGRLADPETGYEPFGNTVKLPAADAEGHTLTTGFYIDGAVAEQSQNGVSHEYKLDPEGRVDETTTAGSTVISHYDGTGEAVSWTSEEEGKKTTRNIPSVDGTLTATQTNNELPILQLHDLEGDTVATIGDSASETKLRSTYNSTEFGTPNKGKPPKYAWLGAAGISTELESGVITYGATSYVPQTGRALQADQVIPPGLPDGSGAGAPVTFQMEPWNIAGAQRAANESPGLEAAREREAAEAACLATHVCEAGEGETGPYDPPGLASYNRTLERSAQLEDDAVNTVYLELLMSTFPELDEVAESVQAWTAALKASASSLAGCASAKDIKGDGVAYEWGTCYITEKRFGIGKVSAPLWAKAELCLYEKTNRADQNEYHCLQSKRRHVTGPWFS